MMNETIRKVVTESKDNYVVQLVDLWMSGDASNEAMVLELMQSVNVSWDDLQVEYEKRYKEMHLHKVDAPPSWHDTNGGIPLKINEARFSKILSVQSVIFENYNGYPNASDALAKAMALWKGNMHTLNLKNCAVKSGIPTGCKMANLESCNVGRSAISEMSSYCDIVILYGCYYNEFPVQLFTGSLKSLLIAAADIWHDLVDMSTSGQGLKIFHWNLKVHKKIDLAMLPRSIESLTLSGMAEAIEGIEKMTNLKELDVKNLHLGKPSDEYLRKIQQENPNIEIKK